MVGGPEARLLARRMSDVSEDHWCAGWFIGCEYALWADLTGAPTVAGKKAWGISDSDREELQLLHQLAGGWIAWPEDSREQVFLTTQEWLEFLAKKSEASSSMAFEIP